MDDREEKLQQLKTYFENRDDIMMAFVFGSQATGRAHAGSDWDIGVYFRPEEGRIEMEEQKREYPRSNVWSDCVDILKTDNIDIIVLNQAAASIADSAIRGMPIVIKDPRLFTEFMLRITSAAIDFRETAREYADIYWRSSSLTPGDASSLERRLVFIDQEFKILPEFAGLDWLTYQKDGHTRRDVERWIENIMNAVIDCSKIIIASDKKPVPQAYKEIVMQACVLLDFSEEESTRLASWVILRNILAHEYLDYRWKDVSDFLGHGAEYIGKFVASARTFLDEHR